MRIRQVTFGKNFQTKPFHFERAEVTVELSEADTLRSDVDTATKIAKEECDRILGLDISEDDIQKAEDDIQRAQETLEKARKVGKL